jgi:predicted Zn finger-like uncharacterized protein
MIVTCENCHVSYKLDASVLDPAGSRVRCTNCGHVFIAYPPPEVPVPADDERPPGAGGSPVAGAVDDGPSLDFDASPRSEKGVETAFPPDWRLDEEDERVAGLEADGTDGLGLDLDLDLDFDEAGERAGAATEEIQDLDLDLDLEETETSLEPTAGGDQDLDLDLDLDLDGELGEDLLPGRTNGSEDLDLGLEPLGSEPVQTETEVFEQEEIDLGDIDKMLHSDEEAMSTEKADPDGDDTGAETDSLGIETAQIAADLARVSQTEAEVDLYGEETGAPRDRAGDEEIADPGEVYTLRTASDADGQISLTAEAEPIVAREAMAAPARRRFTWLWVLLVLPGLAGGGGYWAWQQGFDLASLKQLLGQPAADEAGNLKISTLAIDSRFVDNATAGRLFIITGKARNDYDHPRSRIQIKSSLLAKGKRLVGSETVFCGNVLTDLDLSCLEMAEIQRRLDQQAGANDSNLEVSPGGLVPFMVAFSNLPPDLEEFTIEVVSSSR